MDIFSELFGT